MEAYMLTKDTLMLISAAFHLPREGSHLPVAAYMLPNAALMLISAMHWVGIMPPLPDRKVKMGGMSMYLAGRTI